MRNEDSSESKGEKAFVAKSIYCKGKGKIVNCTHCHKDGHHEKDDCWHNNGKPQCLDCKKIGHLAKNCRLKKEEDSSMAQVTVEETLF